MPANTDTKDKVLLVSFDFVPSPSGMSCWVADEIKTLSSYYQLDVLSLKNEDLSHIERFHGARLLRVPVGTGPFLEKIKTFQRALKRQLDSEEYRLCHFSSVWEGMILTSQKGSSGYKLIYEVHSLPSVDFKTLYPGEAPEVEHSYPLKQQEERCLSLADFIVAGSELLKNHLIERGISADKIEVVRPMIDLAPFEKVESGDRQTGTILYLGSLLPWQGIPSMLRAIAELPHGLPVKVHLICPPDDPFRKEVLGKIQMLGLARKVEMIDPVEFEQLGKLVARADVCVAPLSNHEHNRLAASTPQKLFVYMACSRAIVASSQPVALEIIENGVHGLLYPPGDFKGLAASLKKLLLDRDLAVRLGNQARLHLEDSFSLKGSMKQLTGIYQRLIGSVSQPPEFNPLDQADPDTMPRISEILGSESLETDPDTSPHPKSLIDGRGKFSADTTPIPIKNLQLPETNPNIAGQTVGLDDPAKETGPALMKAGTEPGTDPEIPEPGTDPEIPEPGTDPVIPEPGTDPARPPSTADTDPDLQTQDDLVFLSVDDEDTAPRSNPDGWQVLEASLVTLPEQESDSTETEPVKGRFLLGGPPFPVKSEEPEPIETSRKKKATDTTPTNLDFISDADVELIDGDSGDKEPRDKDATDPEVGKQ
ncbi:MAG: glycosyltransferase [Deltaproteobacteria bacterium]|nr:glycosyltransferase [Deltaproteobacteria bacterium]